MLAQQVSCRLAAWQGPRDLTLGWWCLAAARQRSAGSFPSLGCCRKITDESVVCISRLTSLTRLDISGCSEVTDEGVIALCKVPRIAELDLSHCRITNRAMISLARLPTLRRLAVRGCEDLTDEAVTLLTESAALRRLASISFSAIFPSNFLANFPADFPINFLDNFPANV